MWWKVLNYWNPSYLLVQTYFGTPLYGLHQFFLALSKCTNQQLKINVKFPLPVTEIHYSLLSELTLVHFPLKTKVLATESNTFKCRIREAIEIRLRKYSLNRDNGFKLANIYNTILGPLRPLWSDITLLNIHISIVADEVWLIRTKYSVSTV